MIGNLLYLAAALCSLLDPPATFTLGVRGAVTTTTKGLAESGPTGTPADAFYSITLGGPAGEAAVVLTRSGAGSPRVGVYRVGEGELLRGGFSGLVITGMPAHPTGVFRVARGTLIITSTTSNRVAGHFVLESVGFQTERPEDEARKVTADGAFTARVVDRDANLTLNRGPGQ